MASTPTPASMPLLANKRGHSNPPEAVSYWRNILISQGYTSVAPKGAYDGPLEEVTRNFQMTRVDRHGRPLVVDGEVGPATWWAGFNPSGDAQRNFLEGSIPKGLSAQRTAILRAALGDHQKGVREVPDGSNYGDGVTRYLHGVGPAAWCCFALSEWVHDGTGAWPLGERQGLVAGLWNKARREKRNYGRELCPVPGDAFVFLYRRNDGKLSGQGHTGIVLSVGNDQNIWNAIEGNAGNRVKLTTRDTQSTLVLAGFVDLVGDSEQVRGKFQRGLAKAGARTGTSLRETR